MLRFGSIPIRFSTRRLERIDSVIIVPPEGSEAMEAAAVKSAAIKMNERKHVLGVYMVNSRASDPRITSPRRAAPLEVARECVRVHLTVVRAGRRGRRGPLVQEISCLRGPAPPD